MLKFFSCKLTQACFAGIGVHKWRPLQMQLHLVLGMLARFLIPACFCVFFLIRLISYEFLFFSLLFRRAVSVTIAYLLHDLGRVLQRQPVVT